MVIDTKQIKILLFNKKINLKFFKSPSRPPPSYPTPPPPCVSILLCIIVLQRRFALERNRFYGAAQVNMASEESSTIPKENQVTPSNEETETMVIALRRF